jgi:hypothetical protein
LGGPVVVILDTSTKSSKLIELQKTWVRTGSGCHCLRREIIFC